MEIVLALLAIIIFYSGPHAFKLVANKSENIKKLYRVLWLGIPIMLLTITWMLI
jgi:hypothetical protein